LNLVGLGFITAQFNSTRKHDTNLKLRLVAMEFGGFGRIFCVLVLFIQHHPYISLRAAAVCPLQLPNLSTKFKGLPRLSRRRWIKSMLTSPLRSYVSASARPPDLAFGCRFAICLQLIALGQSLLICEKDSKVHADIFFLPGILIQNSKNGVVSARRAADSGTGHGPVSKYWIQSRMRHVRVEKGVAELICKSCCCCLDPAPPPPHHEHHHSALPSQPRYPP
jgi:hypothetical protein